MSKAPDKKATNKTTDVISIGEDFIANPRPIYRGGRYEIYRGRLADPNNPKYKGPRFVSKRVAIKRFRKIGAQDAIRSERSLYNHVQKIQALKCHPNLLMPLWLFVDPNGFIINTVYELVNYNQSGRYREVYRGIPYTAAEVAEIAYGVCHGLQALFDSNILPGNLRAENLMFPVGGRLRDVKIGDWEASCVLPEGKHNRPTRPIGTTTHYAPEICHRLLMDYNRSYLLTQEQKSIATYGNRETEMWAFGILLTEALANRDILVPATMENWDRLHDQLWLDIPQKKFKINIAGLKVPPQAIELIDNSLLVVSPSRRLKLPDVLRNPWIRSGAPKQQASVSTTDTQPSGRNTSATQIASSSGGQNNSASLATKRLSDFKKAKRSIQELFHH